MAESQSPLGRTFTPGDHGNSAAGVGVTLRERKNLSIIQVTAWPDTIPTVLTAIGSATGLVLQNKPGLGRVAGEKSVFGFAPGRYFVVSATPDLESRLRSAISPELGTMVDLTHGRTVIRVSGPHCGMDIVETLCHRLFRACLPHRLRTRHAASRHSCQHTADR